MPAAITHFLHSQRVLAGTKQAGRETFSPEAFAWGAQGPDFFYCHRFLPWWRGKSLAGWGDRLHDAPPAETLASMWRYVKAHPEDRYARSYAQGFLCHYAADSVCHPFVEYRASLMAKENPPQTESVCHNEIESALDLIMLRSERGALPSELPLRRTVPRCRLAERSIAKLYQQVLLDLFHESVTEELLLQCLKDCRKIFSLLTDRTGLKKNIVRAWEGGKKHTISCHIRGLMETDEYDYANIHHDVWRWPLDSVQERRESFPELYEQAVALAVRYLQEAPSCTDFAALTGNRPFV